MDKGVNIGTPLEVLDGLLTILDEEVAGTPLLEIDGGVLRLVLLEGDEVLIDGPLMLELDGELEPLMPGDDDELIVSMLPLELNGPLEVPLLIC